MVELVDDLERIALTVEVDGDDLPPLAAPLLAQRDAAGEEVVGFDLAGDRNAGRGRRVDQWLTSSSEPVVPSRLEALLAGAASASAVGKW